MDWRAETCLIAVISYRTEQEAIEISNDSTYGLSVYVISSNRARAEVVARQRQTGRVSINGAPHDPMAVASSAEDK
jgi:aldehyde dehydrogenase (NAD+)